MIFRVRPLWVGCGPSLVDCFQQEPDDASRVPMKNLYKALILAAFFAVITAIAALLQGAPWTNSTWKEMLVGMGSFGCFGFLSGGVYAFDPESELKIKPSSIGRMFFDAQTDVWQFFQNLGTHD